MQNILLQELEDFNGILMATTNLTSNLDEAFDRRFLYKIFGSFIVKIMDPTLRKIKKGNCEQIKSWTRDQYEHPVESLHTLDEVLNWFEKNNIQFINSIPTCSPETSYNQELFNRASKGTIVTRVLSQIFMLFNNLGADGGLFIVIGKKN